jgi:hypothetical protein
MSGGYNAKVVNPDSYKVQTESGGYQKPMFQGASQVPTALGLHKATYSGAGVAEKKLTVDTHHKVYMPMR